MSNLTRDERLAFYIALDKKLNDRRTGILSLMKEDARAELMESYSEIGADRKAIMANGVKVGDMSLTYNSSKPCILADRMEEALDFLEDLDMVERKPKKDWESRFKAIDGRVFCTETGEFVDWAIWQPSSVKCATVRGCKPQDVLDALAPKLNYGSMEFYGLLMGESE